MSYLPIGPKGKAFSVPVQPATDAFPNPFPSAPTMTLYSPSTTAYVKVTPAADTLLMTVAPTVTTETLTYASLITHKIADATSIAADNPAVGEAQSYALSIELADDFSTHITSTAYHATADTALVTTNATSEATLIAEVNAIRAKMLTHFASSTIHGGRADAVALAATAATTVANSAASAITLENALATAYLAHLAVVDGAIYMTTGAAVMPMEWACLGAFWCKTNVSGHTFATAEFKSA
jgi:hypothetical protein